MVPSLIKVFFQRVWGQSPQVALVGILILTSLAIHGEDWRVEFVRSCVSYDNNCDVSGDFHEFLYHVDGMDRRSFRVNRSHADGVHHLKTYRNENLLLIEMNLVDRFSEEESQLRSLNVVRVSDLQEITKRPIRVSDLSISPDADYAVFESFYALHFYPRHLTHYVNLLILKDQQDPIDETDILKVLPRDDPYGDRSRMKNRFDLRNVLWDMKNRRVAFLGTDQHYYDSLYVIPLHRNVDVNETCQIPLQRQVLFPEHAMYTMRHVNERERFSLNPRDIASRYDIPRVKSAIWMWGSAIAINQDIVTVTSNSQWSRRIGVQFEVDVEQACEGI